MAAEPTDMLVQVTKALTELGLSVQQLNSIKFTGKHRHRPMDEWPLTWDTHIPIESIPHILSLMRQYAILKYALIDGPAENSSHVAEAFARPGFGEYFGWRAGLDAALKGDSYIYLDDKTLAYVTFRNYVRDARNSISH